MFVCARWLKFIFYENTLQSTPQNSAILFIHIRLGGAFSGK